MPVISIMNRKGGCGKTTTAINLSACLAHRGQRVLLVDLDPERHATVGLGARGNARPAAALSRVLVGSAALLEATLPVSEKLDLALSDDGLKGVLGGPVDREVSPEALDRALAPARESYGYIVLDCPPASGPLSHAALHAADEVIIAVETSFFALNGVKRLLDQIERSRAETGRPRRVRALATMYDRRTSFAREVLGEIRDYFRDALYENVIGYTVRLKEATSHGLSIVDYDRSSRAFSDYLGLADEVLASSTRAASDETKQPEWRSMYG